MENASFEFKSGRLDDGCPYVAIGDRKTRKLLADFLRSGTGPAPGYTVYGARALNHRFALDLPARHGGGDFSSNECPYPEVCDILLPDVAGYVLADVALTAAIKWRWTNFRIGFFAPGDGAEPMGFFTDVEHWSLLSPALRALFANVKTIEPSLHIYTDGRK